LLTSKDQPLLVWGNALLVLNHIKQYVRKSVVLELYSCMHWLSDQYRPNKKDTTS
jgi:hypothetical protein